MKWINFLHLYQPPTQSKENIGRLVRETYSLIPELMEKYPRMKLTLNISGSLLELLDQYGYGDVIDKYRALLNEGRIELTGSAMYHPIMPLVSPEILKRQIRRNTVTMRTFLGEKAGSPKGFFFPEMAYSRVAGEIVKELGFEWTILSGRHLSNPADPNIKHEILDSGLVALFRDGEVSRSFPPEYIIVNKDSMPATLITAHDGELYGHWHTDDRGFYEKAFSDQGVEMITASEHIESLTQKDVVKLRKASWESTEEEIVSRNPYILWNMPGNLIHKKLWELAKISEKILDANSQDPYIESAKVILDKGFSSCAWWWASGRKLGPWSPVSWNPAEIEKGGRLLLESVRTLKEAPTEQRIIAEKAFSKLRDLVWSMHWNKYYGK